MIGGEQWLPLCWPNPHTSLCYRLLRYFCHTFVYLYIGDDTMQCFDNIIIALPGHYHHCHRHGGYILARKFETAVEVAFAVGGTSGKFTAFASASKSGVVFVRSAARLLPWLAFLMKSLLPVFSASGLVSYTQKGLLWPRSPAPLPPWRTANTPSPKEREPLWKVG